MWMHYLIIDDKKQKFYVDDGNWTNDPLHATSFNYHADAQHIAKMERANNKTVTIMYVGLGKHEFTPNFQECLKAIDKYLTKQNNSSK